MQAPAAFLRLVARFVFNAAEGAEGGNLIDDRPRRAEDVWAAWSRSRTAADRRVEILALARAPAKAVGSLAERIAAEAAPNRSPAFRARLATGLGFIPHLIRNWLRRADDPRGITITEALLPFRSEDLLPLIPERLPCYKSGDRPFANVERELDELLGLNRFSETWLAVDPVTSAVPPVVFKFSVDPVTAEHLRNPQNAALLDLLGTGRMSGVVPLRQTYLGADPPCLGYEYVSGGDVAGLTYHLHHNKAPAEAFHRLLRKVAATVGAFHRLTPAVVHGNLKPANVLVEQRDGGPSATTGRRAHARTCSRWARCGIRCCWATWRNRCRRVRHGAAGCSATASPRRSSNSSRSVSTTTPPGAFPTRPCWPNASTRYCGSPPRTRPNSPPSRVPARPGRTRRGGRRSSGSSRATVAWSNVSSVRRSTRSTRRWRAGTTRPPSAASAPRPVPDAAISPAPPTT